MTLTATNTDVTIGTQRLTDVVAIAMEMAISQRMWPITNPPIPATTVVLKN